MYQLEDLFDKRSVVGARLERILVEKNCTKAELYKNTHVSRPTIDKILEGTITSKKNYETHMSKIMEYLQISPDMLLGNIVCRKNRVREMRSVIKMSTESMAKATGISQERLQQIESGGQATMAELRDLAWELSISTHVLTDTYFFEPQMGTPEIFVEDSKVQGGINGFWGHVGILLKGSEKYRWYPITANTRDMVFHKIDDELLVIPCMDNKILFLYMPNVEEVILSDFDVGEPSDKDWNPAVSCGEMPLVLYEALEDYCDGEMEAISGKMKKILECYVEKSGQTENELYYMLKTSVIYYANGKERWAQIEFDDDTISETIEEVYGYGMSNVRERFFFYSDNTDGSENFLNVKKISMIELPLLKVEEAIYRRSCLED